MEKETKKKFFIVQRFKHKTETLKTTTNRKKETVGHATPSWTTIPGMDRWEILIAHSDTSC